MEGIYVTHVIHRKIIIIHKHWSTRISTKISHVICSWPIVHGPGGPVGQLVLTDTHCFTIPYQLKPFRVSGYQHRWLPKNSFNSVLSWQKCAGKEKLCTSVPCNRFKWNLSWVNTMKIRQPATSALSWGSITAKRYIQDGSDAEILRSMLRSRESKLNGWN